MENEATKGEDDAFREYERERYKNYYYAHREAVLAKLKKKRIAQKILKQKWLTFGLPDDIVRQMLTAKIQEEK